MNICFALAGGLAILLGLVHSILGEILLLRRLRKDSLPVLAPFSLFEVRPLGLTGNPDLALGTLRFTWHLPTVLGLGVAAILLGLATPSAAGTPLVFIERVLALSLLACTLVVLVISKGKHPGWIVFLVITILVWLGMNPAS
jgi:hypothetical protein